MKALRLFGVLCVTAAGLLVTRFSGPPEIGLAAAALLAVVGLALFVSRPRRKVSLQLRSVAPVPHAHASPARAWPA